MNYTNKVNFIQDALNATRPSVVVFFDKIEDTDSFRDTLLKYQAAAPGLPLFFYDTSVEDNQMLAEHLGINKSPTLMVFKERDVHRWLEAKAGSKITPAAALKFVGSPVSYGVPRSEAPAVLEAVKKKNPKKPKL